MKQMITRWLRQVRFPRPIGVLILFALVTRVVVVTWGLPYSGNLAHEHSLFYDSAAVVHDQYVAMRALYRGAAGPFTTGTESLMPLLQRYIAAVPLAGWFFVTDGSTPEEVQRLPFAVHTYKAILVNRLISLAASLGVLYILYVLLKKYGAPEWLAVLVTAVFALNPVEIGLAIHEKTITLLTLILALQFYWLTRFDEALREGSHKSFRWLWLTAFAVGVAGAAREQGLFFAGLLCSIGAVWILRGKWRVYLTLRRIAELVTAPIAALAVTSPDFLIKWRFWVIKFFEPHRPWDFTPDAGVGADMWYLLEVLFAGSVGAGLFLAAFVWLASRFRSLDRGAQIMVMWLPFLLAAVFFYPLKAPRFAQPLIFLGLLFMALATVKLFERKPMRKVVAVGLAIWLAQSAVWGASALAFFAGDDNLIKAADDFHATMPVGTSVATFFRDRHTGSIPIDPARYDLYAYDNKHSTPDKLLFVPSDETGLALDAEGRFIGLTEVHPDFILVQYEDENASPSPEKKAMSEFRDAVQKSGDYRLVRTYHKRTWRGYAVGLFATKSRWAYLNPVVEVYAHK